MKKIAAMCLVILFMFLFGCSRQQTQTISLQTENGEIKTQILPTATRYCKKNKMSYEKYYSQLLSQLGNEKEALEHISSGLYDKLLELALQYEKEAISPSAKFIAEAKQPFEYTNGQKGSFVDMQKLCRSAARAFDGGELEICVEEVSPQSLDEIKCKTSLMSTFFTDFSTSSEARQQNIELAAAKLNGWAIASGGNFSFNNIVGSRTTENGFQIAKVIENGEYIDGVGGGVCQVSSTLYNAWLLAGLSVTERRSHTMPASYVDMGRDATVSDNIDLVLTNDCQDTVYLQAIAKEGKLTVNIYGRPTDNRVEITTKKVADIQPPPPKIIGEGQYLIAETEAKLGCVVRSWQCFYSGDRLLKTVQLKDSYYAPKQAVQYYSVQKAEADNRINQT